MMKMMVMVLNDGEWMGAAAEIRYGMVRRGKGCVRNEWPLLGIIRRNALFRQALNCVGVMVDWLANLLAGYELRYLSHMPFYLSPSRLYSQRVWHFVHR